jgi:hypothetical protein
MQSVRCCLGQQKGLKLCTLTLSLKDTLPEGLDRVPCAFEKLSSQHV